jgi:hypothetical protein
VTRSSPTTQSWTKEGAERCRRARSTVLGGAGRCSLAAGETAAQVAQGVAWVDVAGH